MSEVIKDSAIKLFGQTICVPPAAAADASLSQHSHRHSSLQSSTSQDSKDSSISEYESSNNNPSEEKSASSSISSDKSSSDGGGPQKKAEKIIPCPRCSSMDTKFCYFNNYNVNQPRHFCKKCQRYWTCGGTMRNVAVGSGRRKTKSSSSYHGIMVSDADAFVFSPHGFPLSFYPAAFYCNAPSVLGKHSRENLDGVLVPKTLRIHDPSEAAKSSIWTTLGIKGERRRGGDERAVLLRANPAAFSRSLNFHETA